MFDNSFQTHEDYRGLERAKEAMVDVAQYINEVKRDSEHLDIIQKIRVSVLLLSEVINLRKLLARALGLQTAPHQTLFFISGANI